MLYGANGWFTRSKTFFYDNSYSTMLSTMRRTGCPYSLSFWAKTRPALGANKSSVSVGVSLIVKTDVLSLSFWESLEWNDFNYSLQ